MKRAHLALAGVAAIVLFTGTSAAQPVVRVYAAGSLSAGMTAIAKAVEKDYGLHVALTFGPSGVLRERIEKGEPADLFASADMKHPRTLSGSGLSGPTVLFARNALCAFTRPDVGASSEGLLDRMLDPKIKVGTSTPVADPAGDYAWQSFRQADKVKPGAYATLDAKALKLTGDAGAPPLAAPNGRNITAFSLENRSADIFLLYCSGASAIQQDPAGAVVIHLPASLAVSAEYGMTVMKKASADAALLSQFILSSAGQRILRSAGFSTVTLPQDEPER